RSAHRRAPRATLSAAPRVPAASRAASRSGRDGAGSRREPASSGRPSRASRRRPSSCPGRCELGPLSGLLELADPASDEIALERAHPLDEGNTVEMIDLVAERARQKPLPLDLVHLPVEIARARLRPGRALDPLREDGEGQAPFVLGDLSSLLQQ